MSERKTITFQPAQDVGRMLKRATSSNGAGIHGMRTHLINQALRGFLTKKGYARKKEQFA